MTSRFALNRLLLWSVLAVAVVVLFGCGGGGDGPDTSVQAMKIEDRRGMLGGENKPDPFGVEPGAQPAQDDEVEPAWQGKIIRANGVAFEDTVGYKRVFLCECSIPANGQTFVVTLQPLETDEDSDLYVYRPAPAGGERIGYSRRGHAGNTLATPDWVAFEASETGRHLINLYGYSPTTPGDRNDFSIEADRAFALVVDGAARTKGVAAGESRWYYFEALTGMEYTVTLTSNSGDADLFVYEDASDELVDQSTNPGAVDTVSFTASDFVRHYVRVYGALAADFALSVSLGAASCRYIVFSSARAGGEGGSDVYLHDRQAADLVAVPGLNCSTCDMSPDISVDGRWIVFLSDRAGADQDVYLYDRQAATLVAVPGLNSLSNEWYPAVNGDGTYIAFQSNRPGGVGGIDLYLYDCVSNSLVAVPGLNSANDDNLPSLSADARYIAFQSDRVQPGVQFDVCLFDRDISDLVALPGLNSTDYDHSASISGDGQYIAFVSDRAGGEGNKDVYLYSRQASALVSLPGLNSAVDDQLPAISSDGRYIAFQSDRPGGVGGWDGYLYDRVGASLIALPGMNGTTNDWEVELNQRRRAGI